MIASAPPELQAMTGRLLWATSHTSTGVGIGEQKNWESISGAAATGWSGPGRIEAGRP